MSAQRPPNTNPRPKNNPSAVPITTASQSFAVRVANTTKQITKNATPATRSAC
jgi:hypothetical protein